MSSGPVTLECTRLECVQQASNDTGVCFITIRLGACGITAMASLAAPYALPRISIVICSVSVER